MKYFSITLLVAIAFCGCDNTAQSRYDRDPQATTTSNAADYRSSAKTSFNQSEDSADVDTTAKIRRQVVDTDMSVNAHNVKIVTQDGKVILRGPVDSQTEKQRIEAIALAIAGNGNIDNQLEVKF